MGDLAAPVGFFVVALLHEHSRSTVSLPKAVGVQLVVLFFGPAYLSLWTRATSCFSKKMYESYICVRLSYFEGEQDGQKLSCTA